MLQMARLLAGGFLARRLLLLAPHSPKCLALAWLSLCIALDPPRPFACAVHAPHRGDLHHQCASADADGQRRARSSLEANVPASSLAGGIGYSPYLPAFPQVSHMELGEDTFPLGCREL